MPGAAGTRGGEGYAMVRIEIARCSCGGTVTEAEMTEGERRQFDTALECDRCRTRFVLAFEPPELAWE